MCVAGVGGVSEGGAPVGAASLFLEAGEKVPCNLMYTVRECQGLASIP